MGFDCALEEVHIFTYQVEFGELTENEVDHVFIGKYDRDINPNKQEVEEYKWIDLNELKQDIEENPNKHTPWFKIILKEYFLSKQDERSLYKIQK